MGRIVDYNLKEEMEHGLYVSLLVRELCKELHLDKQFCYQMTLAGFLHDIGKLRLTNYIEGIEEIESPLVIEEMKYVRLHSMLSYEILKERNYPDDILEAVRYHHENYDGSGYPSNLAGEDIPLGSRIIRVCDVFAALTSDRPYRGHFDKEEAISLMIDEINHFDMKIFLAFQRVVHRKGVEYRMHLPIDDSILWEK